MELIVHETAAEASAALAKATADAIAEKTGRFSWGLAGGSTPVPVYEMLRGTNVEWSRVDGWLSDERWVAADSERSNGKMVSRLLFDHIPAHLHRPVTGQDASPHQSATDYERRLEELHGTTPDLVFLGLGDDGHTASLFPGSTALEETRRRFVENAIPGTGEVRLTATYPLLDDARQILFLVVGEGKAEAMRSSLEGESPAGRVSEGKGQVVWHIDRLAASLL